jgi:hypothetical protein
MKRYYLILVFCTVAICFGCGSPNNGSKGQSREKTGAYLFAHMIHDNYGGMYYSVSEDGVNWTTLNDTLPVSAYRGHPDFCLGKDGRYYMIGVVMNEGVGQPVLWATDDLVKWKIEKQIPLSTMDVSAFGHETTKYWAGAPKMYYDKYSKQYIITWHAPLAGLAPGIPDDDATKRYWCSIRTFYILTSDFETFTTPQRLFAFTGEYENMPTMDVIIRKIDGKYYAFIKDERWPGDTPEGYKAISIAKSDNLTGHYENPWRPVTDTWHEAQTIVPKKGDPANGWFLFVEHYPIEYALYEAITIEGAWTKKEIHSPDARHGSITWVDADTYKAILKAYKK